MRSCQAVTSSRRSQCSSGPGSFATRSRRNSGALAAGRIADLDTLDRWVWDARDAKWDAGFAASPGASAEPVFGPVASPHDSQNRTHLRGPRPRR